MADNVGMRDFDGIRKVMRTTDDGVSHRPHHIVDDISVVPALSAPAVAKLILNAAPGSLYEANCHALIDGYFWIFNAVDIPANGANAPFIVPKRVLAGSWLNISPKKPIRFSTGITLAFSTTLNTAGAWNFTTSANAIFDGQIGQQDGRVS